MSNSVVKVTDAALNDSLMLLVGEDGVVTPNRDIVDAFLGKITFEFKAALKWKCFR